MMFNNSSTGEHIEDEDNLVMPVALKITVLCFIMVFALLGNLLLITSIIKSSVRKSTTNVLILNLAFCDTIIVTISIPTDIIGMANDGYFVLGEGGCRLLYPISTYAVIAVVSTLMLISIDRYVATNFPFNYQCLKANTKYALVFAHIMSVSCVIPYIKTLTLEKLEHGFSCGETWSNTSSIVYTIFLFVLGYALPLPIIILLYSRTWVQVKRQNDDVIRENEYRRRRMEPLDSEAVMAVRLEMLRKLHTTERRQSRLQSVFREFSMKLRSRRRGKKIYSTQIAVIRHNQTMHMMKLFITIVTVFSICMLPNHIIWLYKVLKSTSIGDIPETVANWLTYTNSVMNPIIYGIHPKFRKLYSRSFKELLSIVLNLCKTRTQFMEESSHFPMVSKSGTITESVNFGWTPEVSRRRRNADSSLLRREAMLRQSKVLGQGYRRNSSESLLSEDHDFLKANNNNNNRRLNFPLPSINYLGQGYRKNSSDESISSQDNVLLSTNNKDNRRLNSFERSTNIHPLDATESVTSSEISNSAETVKAAANQETDKKSIDSRYLDFYIILDEKGLERIRSLYETDC